MIVMVLCLIVGCEEKTRRKASEKREGKTSVNFFQVPNTNCRMRKSVDFSDKPGRLDGEKLGK